MLWVGIAVIVLGLVGLAVFLYRQPGSFPQPFVLSPRTSTTAPTTTAFRDIGSIAPGDPD